MKTRKPEPQIVEVAITPRELNIVRRALQIYMQSCPDDLAEDVERMVGNLIKLEEAFPVDPFRKQKGKK